MLHSSLPTTDITVNNIIGSGLLAKSFLSHSNVLSNVCIYAAGVSNSNCVDAFEFERERVRLTETLKSYSNVDSFVYFSTCSIADVASQHSAYVLHKLAMENLIARHPNFIIVRLSQVAGNTPNPHTLLNYLYAKISRSEKFSIWKNAIRNIIDIDDVTLIVIQLIKDSKFRRVILNVANPISYSIVTIVAIMEKVIGKTAIADVINKNSSYEIDTTQISEIITKMGLSFDNEYILRVIQKYYG
ncbi:MAG: NAD-dependent dehydratase [Gammaproteobacteria bacterium]